MIKRLYFIFQTVLLEINVDDQTKFMTISGLNIIQA